MRRLGHAARGAVARAVAARSVRAATYRRDFAKGLHVAKRGKLGLFEGTFEEGLSKRQGLSKHEGILRRV